MAGEQRTERGRYGLPPSLPCPNCGRQWDMATWQPGDLACPQCGESGTPYQPFKRRGRKGQQLGVLRTLLGDMFGEDGDGF